MKLVYGLVHINIIMRSYIHSQKECNISINICSYTNAFSSSSLVRILIFSTEGNEVQVLIYNCFVSFISNVLKGHKNLPCHIGLYFDFTDYQNCDNVLASGGKKTCMKRSILGFEWCFHDIESFTSGMF